MKRWIASLLAVVLSLGLLQATLYVLPEGQAALLLRQGRVERSESSPGLHWKLPAPLVSLERLDLRQQLLRSAAAQTLHSADGRVLQLEWALQWQLLDPALAASRLGPGHVAIEQALQTRVNASLQTQLGGLSLDAFTQGLRGSLPARVRDALAADLNGSGVRVLDWRVTRFDVDPALQQSIVAAVTAELASDRSQALAQTRADLAAVRAQAAREHEAQLRQTAAQERAIQAQTVADIVAATDPVYRRNPAFARAWHALLLERDALARQGTVVVLDADSPLLGPLRPSHSTSSAH